VFLNKKIFKLDCFITTFPETERLPTRNWFLPIVQKEKVGVHVAIEIMTNCVGNIRQGWDRELNIPTGSIRGTVSSRWTDICNPLCSVVILSNGSDLQERCSQVWNRVEVK
jgi:hypothetical protein